MSDLAEAKGNALKVMKVTAVGTAAAVIVGLQLTMLSAFLDMITSGILFAIGFAAGRSSK
jgi:hypothetical protein